MGIATSVLKKKFSLSGKKCFQCPERKLFLVPVLNFPVSRKCSDRSSNSVTMLLLLSQPKLLYPNTTEICGNPTEIEPEIVLIEGRSCLPTVLLSTAVPNSLFFFLKKNNLIAVHTVANYCFVCCLLALL